MEFHPAANTFPLMNEVEFMALVESIRAGGQRHPILLFENAILDGRNRYLACVELGIEPKYKDWTGSDPFDYVWDTNAERRNLEPLQKTLLRIKHDSSKETYEAEKRAAIEAANRARSETQAGISKREYSERAVSVDTARSEPKADNRTRKQTAKKVNVSEATAARAQALYNAAPDLAEKVMTGKMSYKAATKEMEKRKREAQRSAMMQAAMDLPQSDRWIVNYGNFQDFTDLSVDAIITDPPYPREFISLYGDLSEYATKVVKPGGLIAVMVGQSYLPEIITMLGRCLCYHWTLAYLTPGGQSSQLWQRKVNTFWKPILIYSNGEYIGDWFGDVCKSAPNDNDKRHHNWGQSESGMEDVIQKLTKPGWTILDPFCGGGTTGVCALSNGLNFIGIDNDEKAVMLTKGRLSDVKH